MYACIPINQWVSQYCADLWQLWARNMFSNQAPQRLAETPEVVSIRRQHTNCNLAVMGWKETVETKQDTNTTKRPWQIYWQSISLGYIKCICSNLFQWSTLEFFIVFLFSKPCVFLLTHISISKNQNVASKSMDSANSCFIYVCLWKNWIDYINF